MSDDKWVSQSLLESFAFRSLSRKSLLVLSRFWIKTKKVKVKQYKAKATWEISNNGDIEFTYAEAKNRLGLSGRSFTRAIDELIAKGFLKINEYGNVYNRKKTLYWIDDRWHRYGRDNFEKSKRKKATRHLGVLKQSLTAELPVTPRQDCR